MRRARQQTNALHPVPVISGGRTDTSRQIEPPPLYWRREGDVETTTSCPSNQILVGDALEELRHLPKASVDTVVTSPPYHLLRRYDGGDREIGTEPTIETYVHNIVAVFDELARVLKPTGVAWLNLGDSYSRHHRYGTAPKSLLLAPERILLALSTRAWIVRAKAVWHKPNHMPASASDRLTMAWEPLYMLVRSPSYVFDLDAIRIPHTSSRRPARRHHSDKYNGTHFAGPLAGRQDGLTRNRLDGTVGHPLGKNPGDVWTIPTAGFRGSHFAVFPEQLVERPIAATCPERVCARCSAAWSRERRRDCLGALQPTCDCGTAWKPGLVLDPFMGSGTVGVVAKQLDRDWLGIELNPEFAALAERRIADTRASPGEPSNNRTT